MRRSSGLVCKMAPGWLVVSLSLTNLGSGGRDQLNLDHGDSGSIVLDKNGGLWPCDRACSVLELFLRSNRKRSCNLQASQNDAFSGKPHPLRIAGVAYERF